MEENERDTADGVREAWEFWLDQHPHSVPEIIESAIKKAFSEWLEQNRGDVLAAIAKEAHHG